jgi:ABC-type antimicrobial peptide transport system permease subunit
MVLLGGIVGAILGFLVGLLITEVIFSNPAGGSNDWQLWVDVVLTAAGALAGTSLTRRFVNRNAKAS